MTNRIEKTAPQLNEMENRLIPYDSVKKIDGSRALVLAPHPDDEVFGCGGAIMCHVAAGDAVHVVIASNGEYRAGDAPQAAYADQRKEESSRAASVLDYGVPEFWGLPDRGIEYGEFLVRRIADAIDTFAADMVYAPSIHEMHPDHRALGMAAVEAVRRHGGELKLAMYEVGVPMARPNLLLDISELRERKQAAMACFSSQLKEQPYDQHIAALNRFRTYTLPSRVTAAEAYFMSSADVLDLDVLGLYESEYQRQNRLGLPMTRRDIPKVSILVRSMDRPLLQDTLDSVALQTYPNIEVVVINARGEAHHQLGAWCGRFPLRVVSTGTPLLRGPAANLGLDSADGDYLLFLDDDDWLAPEHISALVVALKDAGPCRVAYSGVEFRGVSRERLGIEPLNAPFDLGRLYGGNFIPIHAVLFARTLLHQGLRFDETFDVYEDWDFLLQLGKLSRFVHVDRLSAYYRKSGTSGVGVQADDVLKRDARKQIFEKWKQIWSGTQIDDMLNAASNIALVQLDQLRNKLDYSISVLKERELALQDLILKNKELQDKLNENVRLVGEKDIIIQARDAWLHEIFHSTSWRLSAPVRWIGLVILRIKQSIKKGVRRIVGILPWPNGLPEISQGFAGEKLIAPIETVDQPLISVIMPVYNACRIKKGFFLSALESIANQTYKNFELIVVDDGSTDNTRQVYEEFLAHHSDLRAMYLFKENGGQSSARNFGVKACNGDYIGFIDQDDEWYENKLKQVVPWLSDKDIDVLYTDADIIDGDDNVIYGRIHQVHRFGWPHPKKVIEDILFKDIIVMPGLMTIKKQIFDQVGGFDENLSGYEDDDLFLRLFEKGKIFYLPVSTLRWRMYGDNYSFSHRMLTSRTYYWKKLLRNYADNGANIFRIRMISVRFFWQFLNQSLEQYRAGKGLNNKNLDGAREIVPYLPKFQRALFTVAFMFPDKYVIPTMIRVERLFRSLQ